MRRLSVMTGKSAGNRIEKGWWSYLVFLGALAACLLIGACSDGSQWRYDPGISAPPAAFSATSGNGLVSLHWQPATGAANFVYNVYYATSPGVTVDNGAKIPDVQGTSATVTGLTNDVTYYFVVTAVDASGESKASVEIASAPTPPGPFLQSDLQGDWRFTALVSGAGAGWMRGTVAIDAAGNVAVTSFLDSSGGAAAPANLFTTMSILPDGTVLQSGAAAGFHGNLSANLFKDTLVGIAASGAGSRLMAILQKQVSGVTFSSADIKGTGKLVAGPLTFVYHQIASGANQEWEYAAGQIGQDQSATYASVKAPTARQLPAAGGKATSWSITADGIVTETPIAGVQPQPAALLSHGVMSADKMTVVGAMTDANGAFVLRIVQMIHPPSTLLTATSYLPGDLLGSYGVNSLVSGANPLWAYGVMNVDAAGQAGFSSYLNSNSVLTAPVAFTLAVDQQGALTDAADASYNGKLSFSKDLLVSTRTDAAGGSALDISLKK